ncbi:MAG: ATPase domain-containing protein [Candidatus Thermoplasmatota archaeon]|nr:ATPase domain-containing protein [Candidatus Thermoplasmatota archaeon]
MAIFEKIDGLNKEKAQSLYDSGFTNMEMLADAMEEEISTIDGFDIDLAKKVVDHARSASGKDKGADGKEAIEDDVAGQAEGKGGTGQAPTKKGDDKKESTQGDEEKAQTKKREAKEGEDKDALEAWLRGDTDDFLDEGETAEEDKEGKTPPRKKSAKQEKSGGEEDSLKKWLSGEQDSGLEDWLTEEAEPEQAEETIHFSTEDMGDIEKLVKGMVKGIKTGKVDIAKVVTENVAIKKTLEEEMRKRETLENELENVKKSSVAVVKYIKAQQAKLKGKDTAKLQEMLDKQAKIKEKLEIKLRETEAEARAYRDELQKKLDDLAPDVKVVKEKELELLELHKNLAIKEKTLLQKEEALASGEGVLLRELSNGGGASSEEIAEREAVWTEEKQKLMDDKSEAEKQLEAAKLEITQLQEQIKHAGMDDKAVSQELAIREKELANREKDMMLRGEEMGDLRRTMALKDEEIRKLRETVAFKEEELLRREEDLMHREKILDAERRKVEEAKRGIGTMQQQEAQIRLESLKQEIGEKERELKAKEKYMSAKMEELKLREKGVIQEELEAREEDRALEWKIEKIKIGIPRLDDLMMGGVPFGSNVAIYGPPFVGKETMMNIFLAEGLKKGIPAIWVITDKSPAEVREEMSFVVSGYEEYEKMGLVKYIDTYSKSMGEDENDPHTIYIDDITQTKEILKAVEQVSKELMQKHKYYRLAFRSVSTMVAYLGATETFKFLQPFTGRRKRDKAVSMFAIEKGMHKDEEIQSISHTMDGSIDFKTEQLKTYLTVLGIGDVQSRSYVEYGHSKQSINIGSFSLDHIR